MNDPVYILIRTSNRPNYYRTMMKSIRSQTYKNIITIAHSDDKNDKYIDTDIVIRSKRNPKLGRGFYNLYCNKLLQAIPDIKNGWYHFIDDDDMYASPNVIADLVKKSLKTHINIGRSDRGGGKIWPKYWKNQKSFQTECFFLHVKYRNLATWWSKKAGDHNYTKQITRILPINWIKKLLICKAQGGKGRGLRLDK